MVGKINPKYVVTATHELHDKVDEVYEALMDGEHEEALKQLNELTAKVGMMKKDLTTKED